MRAYVESGKGAEPTPWAEASQKYPSSKEKRVAVDTVKGVRVSTVFLVLDHAFDEPYPLLYETMLFTERCGNIFWRHHTKAKAVEFHAIVKSVLEELPLDVAVRVLGWEDEEVRPAKEGTACDG